LATALLSCSVALTLAAAAGFSRTLSPAQLTATGLATLTAAQRETLDAMVSRELQSARQGGVRAFAGTFISRRSTVELNQTGLDRLSAIEKNALNDTVATAIATQLPAPLPVSFLRQSPPETESRLHRRLQVHGEVTLTYGTGRGGSFQGASLYTEMTDPERKVTLGVGLSTFHGDSRLLRCGCYDCRDGW
jgi:hypothetical protein